jgi:glycerol-3-phosphate acyltransferase PlsY
MLIALLIAAYFFGAIPFGFLIAKSKGIDILNFGSGNIGATNVHRALGKGLGLTVLVLDVLKGFLPAVAAFYLLHSNLEAFGVGMAAVGGHCLSPFLKFKGGKGIATGLGALIGSCPLVAAAALGVFIISMIICRYVSASSIAASVMLVPFGFLFHYEPILNGALGCLALFIIYRHRKNIQRLINHTEPKFSLRSKAASDQANVSAAKVVVGLVMTVSLLPVLPHIF